MKKLSFKCTLLTDIVLSQKAATEGNQESLDFIPGNNFLGIVAGELYPTLSPDISLELFHSGKVKFGDAHPSKDGKRGLRIPASMYYAKLEGADDRILIHHEIEKSKCIKEFQPKQFRSGFYDLSSSSVAKPLHQCKIAVEKTFALKSAYDRNARRSEDEKMYGYQSLQKDSEWLFDVVIDTPQITDESIQKALEGQKRIGRSRTAQYGLVNIELLPESKANLEVEVIHPCKGMCILIYAEARLIFLDEYGLPTFQPTTANLGISGGEIDWTKSQIRTFQYAPWNFMRQARDADRCGIEKGSVFYIKQTDEKELKYTGNSFVGVYQNEGFGKVIVNPEFLEAKEKANGESKYFTNAKREKGETKEKERDAKDEATRKATSASGDKVFLFLKKQYEEDRLTQEVYKLVNKFVEAHAKCFGGDSFASQWGSISSMTMQPSEDTRSIRQEIIRYITNGVAKDKWEKHGRKEKLETFLDSVDREFDDPRFARMAITNLAAEMAKKNKEK